MGDLTEKQAGGSTKLIGADPSTGQETFWADVTSEGEIKISSFANVSFLTANKTVNTTESLASVGGSNLANRKSVVIYNRGAQTVYYGVTGVSSTTGIPIDKDELVELELGDNIDVYLITNSSSATVTIQEFA